MSDKPMSILEHLEALRRVLIVSFISLIPGAVLGWYIREDILRILVRPVSNMHQKLVYIGTTEAFTAELKVALIAGVVLASPVIAYQFWKFILPALHAHEKRYIIIFVPVSVLLFAAGVVFGYFTVFTYAIKFFLSFGSDQVNLVLTPMLSLSKYLSFTVWFLLPFGLMFEMPLVILLLARLGIISPEFLAAKRRWAILIAFVISGVVTPTTDMFTQGIMGGAMYLLFEVSIWLCYLMRPRKGARVAELAAAGGQTAIDEGSADGSSGSNDEGAGSAPVGDSGVHSGGSENGTEREGTGDTADTGENANDHAGQHDGGDETTGSWEGSGDEAAGSRESSGDLEEIYRNIIDRGNNDDR